MKKFFLGLSLLSVSSMVLIISLFVYKNYFVEPTDASAAAAVAATGSLVFTVNDTIAFVFGETFWISDGVLSELFYIGNGAGGFNGYCLDSDTFSTSGTAPCLESEGDYTWAVFVDNGGGPEFTEMTTRMVDAINASAINITASSAEDGNIALVNNVVGAAGNVSITSSLVDADWVYSGMSGGSDESGANPTVSAISPSQGSATVVTVTTTIADDDSDVTSLTVEYSSDGSTWTSSTLSAVTQGTEGDGVVTSTGSITDIDTDNDGSIDLTIQWLISADLPNTDDTTVYLRLRPDDANAFGTTVSSSAFAVDTAEPTAPGALSVNSTSTTSVVLNFGTSAVDTNFDSYTIFYKANASTSVSVSDTSFSATTDSNLASSTYGGASTTTISGLTPGLQYVMNIWAYDTYGNVSSSPSEITFYTLAEAASTPTVDNPTATTLDVTIDTATNGTSTQYAIYNDTDSTYIAADGSASSAAVYQVSSTWAGAATASGLSGNTQYCFSVISRNGDGIVAAASSQSCTYTLAATPANGSATVLSGSQIRVNWGANGNSADTTYLVENITTNVNSGWVSALQYTFQGLAEGTLYTFQVRAQNAAEVISSYLTGISGTTSRGAAPVAVNNPEPIVVVDVAPEVDATDPDAEQDVATGEPTPVELTIDVNGDEPQPIPNSSHSVSGIISATPQRATIIVQSDPITVTLERDEETGIDTDSDGIVDLQATYLGLDALGNPKFIFTDLVNPSEDKKAISINKGLKTIQSRNVVLYFNVKDVTSMAVSNGKDFENAAFIPYTASMPWELSEGEGEKIVYVRFRTAGGATADVSDSIIYKKALPVPSVVVSDESEATPTCALTPGRVYKSPGSRAVYQIFENGTVDGNTAPCVKKYFSNATIYFTYYDSWSAVRVVSESRLAQVPADDVPFMPLGPSYDLPSGSLVKATTDPRVFVVLEHTRRWIVSEAVFSALEYTWGWIEDVSEELLEKYEEGDPIDDATEHPAGTVFMYADSPDMYLLEGGLEDRSVLVKRYIRDVDTLTLLGYRLDRVVVIDPTEEYATGEEISL